MKHILLTNDDGYQAIGFYPLLKELSKKFEVTAIAPDSKKSWQGKSISCYKDLEVKKTKLEEFEIFITNGTPADCVQLGLHNLLPKKPDFVVSGINIGLNAGHGRLFSSGTAGAAFEAAINGTKALASSLHVTHKQDQDINYFSPDFYHIYDKPAKITTQIVEKILDNPFNEEIDVISINIPFGADTDTLKEITSVAKSDYGKLFEKIGNIYKYKSSDIDPKINYKNGTDMAALQKNNISITPLNLDLTSEESKKYLETIINKG